MAFKSFRVSVGDSDTDIIECPATQDGAVVLQIGNRANSAVTCDIKLYKQALGTALELIEDLSISANTIEKIPAPISLEAGDKIVMSASSAGDLTASGTFTYSAATPAAVGFTPMGAWSSEATYARNDIAEKDGISYISLQDANTDNDPETETAFWMVLADRGPPGEMSGPAGSTAGNLPSFDDTTGKVLKDSGIAASDVLLSDVENQAVTGGATVTPKSLGTVSSGTLTLDMGDRALQHYTNNGAHTLAPGSVPGCCILDITNAGSAGAITTSGWTRVVGAALLTTTNGHAFRCFCSVGNAGSLLVIMPMQ